MARQWQRPIVEPFDDFALENLLTHPDAFGLESATPLQRAICRVSDGLPLGELWDDETVRGGFGGARPPEGPIKELLITCAIRSAKTMIAAAKAIQMARKCDITGTIPGDEIRIPLVSTEKDQAHALMSHLVAVMRKPRFHDILACDPRYDTVQVTHESGRMIEIKVVALSRYATTLVARWLAGCVFDEAPRMAGLEDGIRNLSESLSSIRGRVLPGGQILEIGSPYAPYGPIWQTHRDHFGKPTNDIVVVKGRGPWMNPVKWTPEACEALRRSDPRAHKTDVEGEFADPDNALIGSVAIERAARVRDVAPTGQFHTAALEPGVHNPTWTLSVLTCTGQRNGRDVYALTLAREWVPRPGESISPETTMRAIAELVIPLGVQTLFTSQFANDTLLRVALDAGLGVVPLTVSHEQRFELIDQLHYLVADDYLALPHDAEDVKRDLLSVTRRRTVQGVTLEFPEGMGGYVRTMALALSVPPGPPEKAGPRRDKMLAEHLAMLDRRQGDHWCTMARRIGGML